LLSENGQSHQWHCAFHSGLPWRAAQQHRCKVPLLISLRLQFESVSQQNFIQKPAHQKNQAAVSGRLIGYPEHLVQG